MEQSLYFLRMPNTSNISAFIPLSEGERFYMQDINREIYDGMLEISEEEMRKIQVDLRTINPNYKLMADLARYGSADQRRIQMGFPDRGVITGGILCWHDGQAFAACSLDGKEYPISQMGATFTAAQVGRMLNPWTIRVYPNSMAPNQEHPMTVCAYTNGLQQFYGHRDIQFVLKYSPHQVGQLLNGIAVSIQGGEYLRDGCLLEGTMGDRRLKAMIKEKTPEDQTEVFRIVIEDKNGLFPEDEGCNPTYAQQALDTDILFD